MGEQVCLVLSGGIALGAYQAGAYAALQESGQYRLTQLAGSSIGAVNAALIAGNPRERSADALHAFWFEAARKAMPGPAFPPDPSGWRHFNSWLNVMQVRLLGSALFYPRFADLLLAGGTALYDLAPLRAMLARMVDFDRLNDGDLRVGVTTTDLETGEAVTFDTGRGDRIRPEHLIASCGFPPDFAPLEIGGRLLGDGALVANAPVEAALLEGPQEDDLLCFVVDLFSAAGGRPENVEAAAARRWDLLFGSQSRRALDRVERELRLRALETGAAPDRQRKIRLFHLCYRAPRYEAGPERQFDFSRSMIEERWERGRVDMTAAIQAAAEREADRPPFSLRRIESARD